MQFGTDKSKYLQEKFQFSLCQWRHWAQNNIQDGGQEKGMNIKYIQKQGRHYKTIKYVIITFRLDDQIYDQF